LIRTFLALELPPIEKKLIQDLLKDLRTRIPYGVKWVEPENLHVTLQFFGDIEPKDIEIITEVSERELAKLDAFSIAVLGCDVFPANNPRLVWLKLKTDYANIMTLPKEIRKSLQSLSYEFDTKPLRLHITLGRVKEALSQESIHYILSRPMPIQSFLAQTVTLYESRLNIRGPVYYPMQQMNLA